MSVREHDYYGPPGSGKTSLMIRIFAQAVREVGPDRVGYCTYTRTAADEARDRAARAVGIVSDARNRLKWSGTIHGLCFRLLGLRTERVVSDKHLAEFAASVGVRYEADRDAESILDGLPYAEYGANDVKAMRYLLTVAANRMIRPEDAMHLIPPRDLARIGEQTLLRMAERWAAYKREMQLWDFDDMLFAGARLSPPVDVLIVDEAQDNSKLLWHVIDAWKPRLKLLACAGDPYQAVFVFNGADPGLFNSRPGTWHTVGDSHRFGPNTAGFARRLLTDVFGDEARRKLATWRGVGGRRVDNTHLCLARTNRLVDTFAEQFVEQGVPFVRWKGRSPLQYRSADAYRALDRWCEGDVLPANRLALVAGQAKRLPHGVKARLEKLTRDETPLGYPDVKRLLQVRPEDVRAELRYADYYAAVKRRGELHRTPKTVISTIHGAKGREADRVTLIESWATLPSRSIQLSEEGRRSEACVAYVGATRHRNRLDIVPYPEGKPYEFPDWGVQEVPPEPIILP